MIEFLKKIIFARFRSLKISMLYALIVALLVSFCTFVSLRTISSAYINDTYLSDESRAEREAHYLSELQAFVDSRELTSEDTDLLARWVRDNRYLYVMIYKDDKLLLDSDSADSIIPPKDEIEKEDTSEVGGEEEDLPTDDTENKGDADGSDLPTDNGDGEDVGGNTPDEGDNLPDDAPTDDEGSDDHYSDTDVNGDQDNGQSPSGDENTEDGPLDTDDTDKNDGEETEDDKKDEYPESGITVTFPTREDLIAYAEAKGTYPIEMTDGTPLLVSMVDYTEYLYYDIANITALSAAVVVVIIIIMLYFGSITGRITKLGRKVSKVRAGDINYSITDGSKRGNDEISELASNVENMRCSMLARISKEREAIDSNNELITSMSHDIRTPLTVLLGYIDIMKMHTNEDTMREYLDAAENTTLRLKEMSDDMFNYFLVFGGEDQVADIEEYDLYTLFEQIVSEKITLMRERGYTVEWNTDDNYIGYEKRPTVLTDAPKLMRIFENVFSNLLKYADKSLPVLLSVSRNEETTSLKIVNSILQKSDEVESNNIGLKTCRKLAEMMNSKFYAEEDGDKFVVLITLKNGGKASE